MSREPDADADVALVAAAYAAYAAGDLDAAVADLAEDVEWIEPDEFPNGGRHVGRAAVREYLRLSLVGWRELRSSPTVYRQGATVVVEHHVEGVLLDGTAQDATFADVFTIEDGRVTHMQAYASPDLMPGGSPV